MIALTSPFSLTSTIPQYPLSIRHHALVVDILRLRITPQGLLKDPVEPGHRQQQKGRLSNGKYDASTSAFVVKVYHLVGGFNPSEKY